MEQVKRTLRYFYKFSKVLGFYSGFNVALTYLLKSEDSIIKLRHPLITDPIFIRNKKNEIELFKQIFIDGMYDIDLEDSIQVIVDIGAHVGLSSLFFHMKYPNALIYAIEPNADNFKILLKNVHNYTWIKTINKALYSNRSRVRLVSKDVKSTGYQYIGQKEESNIGLEVASITLSDVFSIVNSLKIDILKIDIEGAEKDVFSHLPHNLLTNVRILIIETHDKKLEGCTRTLFNYLNSIEYNVSIKGDNFIISLK